MRAWNSFARSDMGQFYFALCCETGMTLRELGRLRDSDAGNYAFMEIAFMEKNKRMIEEAERARNQ